MPFLGRPTPSARAATHRFDAVSLHMLAGEGRDRVTQATATAQPELVWRRAFADLDGTLHALAQSSRTVDVLTSVQTDGGTTTFTVSSSRAHKADRPFVARELDALEKELKKLETERENELEAAPGGSPLADYLRDRVCWLARRLFHSRSYMSYVAEAAVRTMTPLAGVRWIRGVVAEARTTTASEDELSLGPTAFAALKESPLSPMDLRRGVQYPARLLQSGVVRIGNCGVGGDVGVKTLCMFVLSKLVPPKNDEQWTKIMSGDLDGVTVSEDEVAPLLARCEVRT